eukprot:CAMPEP_0180618130 /NCGR_PEP_ID=MMETSP1037_2-20121125/33409_1 /TAXON_ID=632150 /ORGANISM="Azadinium spinosum, Strain 3D9" /LENGTH=150 /DNA_ID=CAMNT_0022638135 /DNA_START=98 /DNA_END=547 /DNA_ORIENTATION=+
MGFRSARRFQRWAFVGCYSVVFPTSHLRLGYAAPWQYVVGVRHAPVVPQEALLDAISSAALARISHFNAQELANTAWAVATLEMWHQETPLQVMPQEMIRRSRADRAVAMWQPFFDCVDVFSLDSLVKGRARLPVASFAARVYMPMGRGR